MAAAPIIPERKTQTAGVLISADHGKLGKLDHTNRPDFDSFIRSKKE